MLVGSSGIELWLAFACWRKPNTEVCQRCSRPTEHLTQRCSQFELSHTLMTPPEACHHGCYPTQWTHSLRSRIWKQKLFHQQKIFIYSLYKTVVCHFLLLCPAEAPCTHCCQFCFRSLGSTMSYWQSSAVGYLYLYVRLRLLKWPQNWNSWNTFVFAAQLMFWHNWLSCITQPCQLRYVTFPCTLTYTISLALTNQFLVKMPFKTY